MSLSPAGNNVFLVPSLILTTFQNSTFFVNLTFRRFVFLFQPVSPVANISLYISVSCFTIFIFFNFSAGHYRCSYISTDFLLLCFCLFSFESVSFIFSKISSRWRKGGEKVEKWWKKRWRKGGERLPVVSLFLRLTLFLTPAASQHLPTLEKQKTFEKYFF